MKGGLERAARLQEAPGWSRRLEREMRLWRMLWAAGWRCNATTWREVSGGRAANFCIPVTTSSFFLHPQLTSYSPASPKFCSCPLFPHSLHAASSSTFSSASQSLQLWRGCLRLSILLGIWGRDSNRKHEKKVFVARVGLGGIATVATVRGCLPAQGWKNQRVEMICSLARRFSLLLSLRCNI